MFWSKALDAFPHRCARRAVLLEHFQQRAGEWLALPLLSFSGIDTEPFARLQKNGAGHVLWFIPLLFLYKNA